MTTIPRAPGRKSRRKRVVDLHEAETLATVGAHVMNERPQDADSRLVFLIGARGTRRLPIGHDGLVRMFSRACARAGIREPWECVITPGRSYRSGPRSSTWTVGSDKNTSAPTGP
ncbi:hypothetical protein [Streptomyces sp. NPDC059168]|uniref:hypothetical protein n=1 Tax=Streptomyces sp. NPDC059168 TaxID=3346753 RepID=UPI0036932B97